MSTATINKPFVIGIGIDVSKAKLDLATRMSDQSYLEASFTNNVKGADALCRFLKRQEAACAAPLIIESTGDYHLRSALIIKQRNYNVKVINPIITKRYQRSSVRNAKTDKIDARRLADIACMEQKLPDFNGNLDHIKARKLVSSLAHLERSRQQMTMSLKRFKQTAKVIKLEHSTDHFEQAIKEIELQIKVTKKLLVSLLPQ